MKVTIDYEYRNYITGKRNYLFLVNDKIEFFGESYTKMRNFFNKAFGVELPKKSEIDYNNQSFYSDKQFDKLSMSGLKYRDYSTNFTYPQQKYEIL